MISFKPSIRRVFALGGIGFVGGLGGFVKRPTHLVGCQRPARLSRFESRVHLTADPGHGLRHVLAFPRLRAPANLRHHAFAFRGRQFAPMGLKRSQRRLQAGVHKGVARRI